MIPAISKKLWAYRVNQGPLFTPIPSIVLKKCLERMRAVDWGEVLISSSMNFHPILECEKETISRSPGVQQLPRDVRRV